MIPNLPEHLKGLTAAEVQQSYDRYGYNQIQKTGKHPLISWLGDLLKEPMLILLIVISAIYLIVGQYGEALFMFFAILAVSGISYYQENRSRKALEELKKLNEPLSTVVRESKIRKIPTHELAVGDLCLVTEGKMINADGEIKYSHDFSVNESSLTGESFSVFKDVRSDDKSVYSGTIVASGMAVFEIKKIGSSTRLGVIGSSLADIQTQPSPLQKQIGAFVRSMAIIGVVIFLGVWAYSFYQTKSIIASLLYGLTMAMSVLPEEIPVAFTTFMALGARKLMREDLIIKRSSVIETLGSTTVICTDKTGTITENKMRLEQLYDFKTNQLVSASGFQNPALQDLIEYAMWSSEPIPFDPMEKTLHEVYSATTKSDDRQRYKMIHEYPLEGKPPMMTHIFENDEGHRIIAAKGAPEAILQVSTLSSEKREIVTKQIQDLGKQGYRLLGVGRAVADNSDFPERQQDFAFEFLGLTIFQDPPKKGIRQVFEKIEQAGIAVKVITGDNPETTKAIAMEAGIAHTGDVITGEQVAAASASELESKARSTTLFARMFPESKLAVVDALKNQGGIVAMLGDGVNDAPALKAAHIGVAMGTKGTEIAKAAADLIITTDDLDRLVTGIAEGRRIYTNIKKAVQYIISIHIPIMLTVSLPLFLGWIYPQIFTPVHVIFLELVMGPTCSIVYENEPMEKNTMLQPPRKITDTFLNWKELNLSIVQGLVITLGVLAAYQWAVYTGGDEESTRTMVFTTLILANVFLSFVNRSFYFSVFQTLKNKNYLLIGITIVVMVALVCILYIPSFAGFFHVKGLMPSEWGVCLLLALLSVMWFEVYKIFVRRRKSAHI